MAQNKKEEKVMVKVKLYKSKELPEAEVVSVNGEAYRIKRGEVVEVPDYIAKVLELSEMQEERALALMEELQEKGEKQLKQITKGQA